MKSVLTDILGGKVVSVLMLRLYHFDEGYAAALASETGYALSAVQRQLYRLEKAGVLASRAAGKTKLYSLNPESPYCNPLKNLLKVAIDALPPQERQKMFATRRRPRRPGNRGLSLP